MDGGIKMNNEVMIELDDAKEKIRELEARAERAEKACAEMRNICEGVVNASKEQFGWPLAIWTHLVYAAENALSTDCGKDYVRREGLEAAKAEVERLRKALLGLWNDCTASDFNEHWESYITAKQALAGKEGE